MKTKRYKNSRKLLFLNNMIFKYSVYYKHVRHVRALTTDHVLSGYYYENVLMKFSVCFCLSIGLLMNR